MVPGLEEVGVVEVVNQEKGHWDPGEYCRLQEGKEGTLDVMMEGTAVSSTEWDAVVKISPSPLVGW